jgi:glutathione S-transferase
MSLTLHLHPLSSFCWKALIGLYELDVPFEKHVVDLSDGAQRAALAGLWPIAKFPVLRDEGAKRTVPESSVLLEYVDQRFGTKNTLLPKDPERALECRLRDRVFDLYIHMPMQKIVGDRLRPAESKDPFGVAQARAQIETTYALVDAQLGRGPWVMGDAFTLADCSAMPALFYANKVAPFVGRWKNLAGYLERLEARPSVARVLREAEPYMHAFPG